MIQEILRIIQEWFWTAEREMYWPKGVEPYGQFVSVLIYVSALVAAIIVLIGIYRGMRVWFHGRYDKEGQSFIQFFFGLIARVFRNLFSKTLPRRLYYSIGLGIKKRKTYGITSIIVHSMIMLGFLGAIIATLVSTLHEYVFYEELLVGPIYLVYSFAADFAGLLLFFGTTMALLRRYVINRDYYEKSSFEDFLLLLLLFWVSFSGFFAEAFRILYGLINHPDFVEFEWVSFVAMPIAQVIHFTIPNISNSQIFAVHFFFYMNHLSTAFIGATYLAFGKFFHIGVGLGNILLKDMTIPKGRLNFPAEGITKIEDFSFYQLFETSACMKCHFCHNYCPANDSGEPLSPLQLIQDIKNWGKKHYGLVSSKKNVPIMGENQEKSGLTEDVLWACVTCYACVNACPHLIGHVDMIVGLRASLIEEGCVPGTFTTMLESVYNYGNLWNQPKRDRTKWLKEGKLPKIKKSKSKLLWLPGDTLAYDPRNQKVARATYKIFERIGLDYGTFGDAEKNDGNEMRRIGEEALFEMLAEENIKMFKKRGVKRIVCSSPHAYNTIKNEYPEFGGDFDVVHITEFLVELIESGRIKFTKKLNYDVTFHDPCYLGRYNGVFDAPRKIIEALPGVKMSEMPNHGQFSYCCGGGGGGMFRETPEWVELRISERRVQEAKSTFDKMGSEERKAKKILITACPFCTSMLTDATKTQQLEEEIEVKDLVELVAEAIGDLPFDTYSFT
ncbi:MAG: (Fe-S)-binding protein [Candidatus Hodarchaeales archaeon]